MKQLTKLNAPVYKESAYKDNSKVDYRVEREEYVRVSANDRWHMVRASTNKGGKQDYHTHLINLSFKRHENYTVSTSKDNTGFTSCVYSPNKHSKIITSFTVIGGQL